MGLDLAAGGDDHTSVVTVVVQDEAPNPNSHWTKWDGLPPAAQRLALCESARLQQIGNYTSTVRQETSGDECWTVEGDEGFIRLIGEIGGPSKMAARFRAQRLSTDLGDALRKLNQHRKHRMEGERILEEQKAPTSESQANALIAAKDREEAAQETVTQLEAELKAVEIDANKETSVVFEFPAKLWEDPAWL